MSAMTPILTIRSALAQIKAVEDQATPGPWRYLNDGSGVWTDEVSDADDGVCSFDDRSEAIRNGPFIAQSRTTQPKLREAVGLMAEQLHKSGHAEWCESRLAAECSCGLTPLLTTLAALLGSGAEGENAGGER